jgi:hypothetical protein
MDFGGFSKQTDISYRLQHLNKEVRMKNTVL